MKLLLRCLLLFAGTSLFAQISNAPDFVIDRSKPFVYLKFDHIGSRKPVQNGEANIGIWLRVVNNCRIPIVFASFVMPKGNPGVGLMDEVVETEPIFQIFNSAEEEKEYRQHERLRKSKQRPVGYAFETAGVVRVQPGEEILFSVPLNHVDADWYMRVKFALDLDKSSISVGPFTYLSFNEWDIPKEIRRSDPPHPKPTYLKK